MDMFLIERYRFSQMIWKGLLCILIVSPIGVGPLLQGAGKEGNLLFQSWPCLKNLLRQVENWTWAVLTWNPCPALSSSLGICILNRACHFSYCYFSKLSILLLTRSWSKRTLYLKESLSLNMCSSHTGLFRKNNLNFIFRITIFTQKIIFILDCDSIILLKQTSLNICIFMK